MSAKPSLIDAADFSAACLYPDKDFSGRKMPIQWECRRGIKYHDCLPLQVEQYLVKAEEVHEDFRLWITAEPHPSFPIGLLQMGIKITNEAPVGMKAGLRASYQWVTQVRYPLSHFLVCLPSDSMPQLLLPLLSEAR